MLGKIIYSGAIKIIQSSTDKLDLQGNLQQEIELIQNQLNDARYKIQNEEQANGRFDTEYHIAAAIQELRKLYFLLNGLNGKWVSSIEDAEQKERNEIRSLFNSKYLNIN